VVSANNPFDPRLMIDIQLDHITAITDGGLAEFRENNFNRQMTRANITAKNSVFGTRTWSSLFMHSGSGVDSDQDSFLKFRGNGNVYDRVSTFWKTSAVTGRSNSIKFTEWQSATEDQSTVQELQWPVQVVPGLPVSQHMSRLYVLDPSDNESISTETGATGFSRTREFPVEIGPSNRPQPDDAF
ncbi:hypothetical protein ACFL2H_05340, partial [Planctomycetota bacterium]